MGSRCVFILPPVEKRQSLVSLNGFIYASVRTVQVTEESSQNSDKSLVGLVVTEEFLFVKDTVS